MKEYSVPFWVRPARLILRDRCRTSAREGSGILQETARGSPCRTFQSGSRRCHDRSDHHGYLRRLLFDYVRYHHEDRTHLGLGKGTPAWRICSARAGRVLPKTISLPWLRSRTFRIRPYIYVSLNHRLLLQLSCRGRPFRTRFASACSTFAVKCHCVFDDGWRFGERQVSSDPILSM